MWMESTRLASSGKRLPPDSIYTPIDKTSYGALLFIVALPHALLLAPIEKLYDSMSQPKPWHAVRIVLRQFEEKPSFVGIVTVSSSGTTLSRGRPVEGVYQIT